MSLYERERRARLLDEVIRDIIANGGGLRMADNLPRGALYDRDVGLTNRPPRDFRAR